MAHLIANHHAVAHGEKPREGRGFTVGGHQIGQDGHDEDAKTEARRALDEAGADAKQEYDDDKMQHDYGLDVCKSSIKLAEKQKI